MGLTLDAGALIAIEKRDRRAQDIVSAALDDKLTVTVPAAVLAQVWRGNSAAISRLLPWCLIEVLDEDRARQIGLLLARARRSDIVDAAVVEGAARRIDAIVTSDPDDIARLLEAAGLDELRIIRV